MGLGKSLGQAAFGAIGGAVVAGVLVTWGIGSIVGHERPEVFGMLATVPAAIVGGISAFPGSRTRMGVRIAVAGGSAFAVFLLVAGFLVIDAGGHVVGNHGLQLVLLVAFGSLMVAAICGLWIAIVLSRETQ